MQFMSNITYGQILSIFITVNKSIQWIVGKKLRIKRKEIQRDNVERDLLTNQEVQGNRHKCAAINSTKSRERKRPTNRRSNKHSHPKMKQISETDKSIIAKQTHSIRNSLKLRDCSKSRPLASHQVRPSFATILFYSRFVALRNSSTISASRLRS